MLVNSGDPLPVTHVDYLELLYLLNSSDSMPRKRQTKDSTPPDFEKKKRKVGKSKKPAENETTLLNFRSGSIVVPSQLAGSSADQPTTHRGLGLDVRLLGSLCSFVCVRACQFNSSPIFNVYNFNILTND